ncbi:MULTISPECIES: succinate--CoA ligase subunit alpha [unclassified Roseofilum]|uniref:succinate--CoA ligase subunit alpha n=1 Tax=unclassified Roseofilum TaxID=2620099 RepID=UPI000E7FD530|nr:MULTISPECIES: CoA-binding protein [unclassified Roseofilum]MBP0010297.1 CoA-binding protein [Roseofilum sp. Belize Diploria]MBP0034274.1 CoA-binding protein [Roseofilum sp. Belize BBD 4]HBQ97453.1 CoA-binding protein [Cyanobacteria bacterium UBA11691]
MNFSHTQKVLVQGITQALGGVHARLMKEYGTNVVAGVSAGDGGQEIEGIPTFDLVEEAVTQVEGIDTSLIFVSPYEMLDAALEAIAAGIRNLILIPSGMPPLDMVKLLRKAEVTETLVLGPNCPGIIVPGQVLLGTHPTQCYTPGRIGVISCADTLTYQVALELSKAGLGQSVGVGLGRETILGSSFAQWLQILEEDDQTDAIVLVGEMGGLGGEEQAAQYISEAIDKPVVAYLAGQQSPKLRRKRHAALIASRLLVGEAKAGRGSMVNTEMGDRKLEAFKAGKISVAQKLADIPRLLKTKLKPASSARGRRSQK